MRGSLKRAAALDRAVLRYRKARDGFIVGAIARLWRDLGGDWHCTPGWAERQVRRHLVACDEWADAVDSGLIRAAASA